MTPQQQIVSKLVKKFPKVGAKTLAAIAYRENPESFMTLEAARSAFRYAFGSNGDACRTKRTDKTAYRKPRKAGASFQSIPRGLTHFEKWGAHVIDGKNTAAILSDIHAPYHDERALVSALRYIQKCSPTLIILNGDIADCFAVSFWEKDPRKRDFAGELKIVKIILTSIRCSFPNARIIFKSGNHEERLIRYMMVKAPELLDLEVLSLRELLDLPALEIELVQEKRPIRLGKLNVIHGHEFRFAIAGPVNPARGFYNKAKAHCIGGHLHQTSQHSEKNLNQNVISTWSTGCLCDLHPDYTPLNQWNHGFAMVDVTKNGIFQVNNMRIVDGECYQ